MSEQSSTPTSPVSSRAPRRILITGANRSLGREAARRLIEAGHTVWIGARDPERGEAAAADLDGRFVQIDVTEDASVAAARDTVAAAGDAPVLVNVSSGMGSLARTTDPGRIESTIVGLPYPSSKSALNMLTSQYAKAYPQMRINAVDPGYTATDFNAHSGPQSVEEGAEIIIRAAQFGPDGPTGAHLDREGTVPW